MSRLWSIALSAVLSGGCVPVANAPNTFTAQPAPTLRAIPLAHGLAVGDRRTVSLVLEDGAERIASVTIEGHATVEDTSIAVLEEGMLVGVAPGTTSVKIVHENNTLTVPVVVTAAAAASLKLDPIAPCRIGERVPVRATVTYADGTSGDVTLDAEWLTGETDLLYVPNTPDTRGAVVAIAPKPASVRARFGELQAVAEIAPAFGEPSGIEVRVAWSYGNFRRFGAFAHWNDHQEREVSAGCLWRVKGEAPFRGLGRTTVGPWIPVAELSWDRTATCELASAKGSGALFAP